MSQASRRGRWYLLSLSLGLAFIVSCSQDNLMGPAPTGASGGITLNNPDGQVSPNFVGWRTNALAKSAGGEVYAEQRIRAKKGGTVGGAETHGVMITIPPKALRKDTKIWIHISASDVLQVDFGPSYQFNKPVLITFDLNNAELAGHDVNQLSIWWYNDATGAWEKVPSTLDGHIISAYVTHFSIYGVGD